MDLSRQRPSLDVVRPRRPRRFVLVLRALWKVGAMSSTNRQEQGLDEIGAEFYPTPAWCVDRILAAERLSGEKPWLEAGAGEGHIIRSALAVRPEIRFHAVELRQNGLDPDGPNTRQLLDAAGAQHIVLGDFLAYRPEGTPEQKPYSVGIFNPPFSLAGAFAEHALSLCDVVVMLQRLNWIAPRDRRAVLERLGPPDMNVLSRRPSFLNEVPLRLRPKKKDGRPKSGTDSIEYCWFVWPAAAGGPRYRVLYEPTSAPGQPALAP